MKHPIIYLLAFVALTSCSKTFNTVTDIDIPHTPLLSLECSNYPGMDSTLLGLKGTKGITAVGNCPVITNGVVQLYEDDVPVSLFQYSTVDQYYSTAFTAFKEGKTYKISATAPGYPSAEVVDVMPSTPENIQFELKNNALKMSYQGIQEVWFDEIKISFDDKANTTDFYSVNIDNNLYSLLLPEDMWQRGKYTVDPDIDAASSSDIGDNANIYYSKVYFQDKNFNGKRKTLVVYVDNGSYGPVPEPNVQTWYIRFDNLSKHAYQYEKTRALYEMNEGNPFAEPVVIHNNVKNGIGSFRLVKTIIDSL